MGSSGGSEVSTLSHNGLTDGWPVWVWLAVTVDFGWGRKIKVTGSSDTTPAPHSPDTIPAPLFAAGLLSSRSRPFPATFSSHLCLPSKFSFLPSAIPHFISSFLLYLSLSPTNAGSGNTIDLNGWLRRFSACAASY